MWTTLEPEDRNQKYASSAQRRPTASITNVIIVVIITTTIILLLVSLKVGSWALSLGAVLQGVRAMMNFRRVSVGHAWPHSSSISLNHSSQFSHKCSALLSLWGQFFTSRACSNNKESKKICVKQTDTVQELWPALGRERIEGWSRENRSREHGDRGSRWGPWTWKDLEIERSKDKM